MPFLRCFIVLEFETSDETAVKKVESWKQFVWEEDVECEESLLEVWWCVFEWI